MSTLGGLLYRKNEGREFKYQLMLSREFICTVNRALG